MPSQSYASHRAPPMPRPACRYFTQALAEDDPGRRDMLFGIATEELSHLEVIGNIVVMLNKGAKGRLTEGVDEEGELYRSITGAGNDSHLTQVLYGAGAPLVNSAGVPWMAAYIDTIGEPTADLRSNIAAEAQRHGHCNTASSALVLGFIGWQRAQLAGCQGRY